MEHEYNDRIKTTQIQYDLAQKKYKDFKYNYNQISHNLLTMQINEKNVKKI